MKNVINKLYDCRTNFSIVALTGYSFSGIDMLSELVQMDGAEYCKMNVRKLAEIKTISINESKLDNTTLCNDDDDYMNHKTVASLIFQREYTICYDYMQNNYAKYDVISYNNALWLYSLIYIASNTCVCSAHSFKEKVIQLVVDKYHPSHKPNYDDDYLTFIDKYKKNFPLFKNCSDILDKYDRWNFLFKTVSNVKFKDIDLNDISIETIQILHKIFISKEFKYFMKYFDDNLSKLDYYCYIFFYHRLGVVLRNTGNPLTPSYESYNNNGIDNSHIYCIISFINLLIKGYRRPSDKKLPCRIIINSIKNSLEAVYLRERYSAFYFISIHDPNENCTKNLLKETIDVKLKDYYKSKTGTEFANKIKDFQYTKILNLYFIESRSTEYTEGKFASPDVEQCVSDAEIHMCNTISTENEICFSSLAEQWMKYASLIQHPGLITPTSDERCMAIAYTAKLNSGCISRQVGAVITNKEHSIQTIGWNDVPYGQIPCYLRDIRDILDNKPDMAEYKNVIYSDFERDNTYLYSNKFSFSSNVQKYIESLHVKKEFKGYPFSYCFKSLHNLFEKNKNQVHTRSLHAEENAMLQLVKYGGISLIDGIIYVTASPCELCCKKLYQIGVRKIIFIDNYPGIAQKNIIANGLRRPHLERYQGAYGRTFFKLYQSFMPYKDELKIRLTKE